MNVDDLLASVEGRSAGSVEAILRRTNPGIKDDVRFALMLHEQLMEEDKPPTCTDRYHFVRKIDSGATANVWLATDNKLNRHVAIKIFDNRDRSVEQVLAEAKAASDIVSDYVVRILDVREDALHPCIVLEVVGEFGPDSSELLIGESAQITRPRSSREAVEWTIQAARGIEAAHRRNVFHGDIKPKNTLITPISRRAMVTDFGQQMIRPQQSDNAHDSISLEYLDIDQQLRVAGTPPFMAPEQAKGVSCSIDPKKSEERRTLMAIDTYGLGALAYQLLTGRAPYEPRDGETPLDILERIRGGELPLDIKAVASFEFGHVPRRLASIIQKAMAFDPADRFRTPGEFAAALSAYLAGEPTRDESGAVLLRSWLWFRRHRSLAILVAALIAFSAVIGVSLWQLQSIKQKKRTLSAEVSSLEGQVDSLTEIIVEKRDDFAKEQRSHRETMYRLNKAIYGLNDTIHHLRESEGEHRRAVAFYKEKSASLQDRLQRILTQSEEILRFYHRSSGQLKEVEGRAETLEESRARALKLAEELLAQAEAAEKAAAAKPEHSLEHEAKGILITLGAYNMDHAMIKASKRRASRRHYQEQRIIELKKAYLEASKLIEEKERSAHLVCREVNRAYVERVAHLGALLDSLVEEARWEPVGHSHPERNDELRRQQGVSPIQ